MSECCHAWEYLASNPQWARCQLCGDKRQWHLLLAAAVRERDDLVAAGKRIMAMHCGPPDGVGNWDAAFDQLEAALAAIRGREGK